MARMAFMCASPPVRLCVRFYSYYVVSVFIVHYICDARRRVR